MVIASLWAYDRVCAFFLGFVNDCAQTVYGQVDEQYPVAVGEQIVACFCRTWDGCPSSSERGGVGRNCESEVDVDSLLD